MDVKALILGLLLAPLASAETFEQQLARELSEGMDGKVAIEPIQADYNYGYGTRTDVYLRGDGQIQVYEHMSSGPSDEVRVYDWQNQESTRQGKQLQPGVKRLWGE